MPDVEPKKKRDLTNAEQRHYLKHSNHCPFADCRSSRIEAGRHEQAGDSVYQTVVCVACGRMWTDEYKLAGALVT